MKIKIDRAPLLTALEACATVADQRSAFPWGACVIIEASGDGLWCRASNSLQAVSRRADGLALTKSGRVMLNAKDTLQRVAALDEGEVQIEELTGSVVIKQGGARYSLPKHDAESAPAASLVEPQGSEVDARAFAALLARVAPMMDPSPGFPERHGIGISTSGGKLWAKATDGGSGAMAPLTFDGALTMVIPSEAVAHLRDVLASVAGSARLAHVGNALCVFADGLSYSTLLTGAIFPPLERVIPKREGPSMTIDRSAALSAVKAVSIGGACEERLMLRPNVKGIVFRGVGKDSASGSRQVDCDCAVKSCSSGVEHVNRMFKFLRGDTVTIWIDDGKRKIGVDGAPGLMVAEEEGALFVVMPRLFYPDDLAPDPAEWT